MCFNLVYCLAGAIVCETVPNRIDVFSHHATLSQQATWIVANLPSKFAFIKGFLSYINPKETSSNAFKWPPFFLDLWEREKTNGKYANSTFRKDNATKLEKLSESDIIYYGWCNHIHDKYYTSRGLITSTLNKLWVPQNKLKSGTSISTLHESIRKFWYHQHGIILAKKYVINEKSKFKKKNGVEMTTTVCLAMHEERVKQHLDKYDAFSIHSYPEEWLTFLFIGKPDYILLGTKNAFNSGQEIQNDANIPRSLSNSG